MNWKQLLAQRKEQLHTTSKQEKNIRSFGLKLLKGMKLGGAPSLFRFRRLFGDAV